MQTKVKQKNPEGFMFGCVCHLPNLCAQGIKQPTGPVDG